jgi:hypothetical protein
MCVKVPVLLDVFGFSLGLGNGGLRSDVTHHVRDAPLIEPSQELNNGAQER